MPAELSSTAPPTECQTVRSHRSDRLVSHQQATVSTAVDAGVGTGCGNVDVIARAVAKVCSVDLNAIDGDGLVVLGREVQSLHRALVELREQILDLD